MSEIVVNCLRCGAEIVTVYWRTRCRRCGYSQNCTEAADG